MTPEAREAAAELVNYVLKDSSPEGAGQKLEPDQQVTMERRILDQICRWQIVVGYRLRELEARARRGGGSVSVHAFFFFFLRCQQISDPF